MKVSTFSNSLTCHKHHQRCTQPIPLVIHRRRVLIGNNPSLNILIILENKIQQYGKGELQYGVEETCHSGNDETCPACGERGLALLLIVRVYGCIGDIIGRIRIYYFYGITLFLFLLLGLLGLPFDDDGSTVDGDGAFVFSLPVKR